jgi:putative Ca2+/H+ antiporter (TMEM165/GDT1 family)
MKLGGRKLQQFCCCGNWCSNSMYILFPLMLIAGEMCDKTQIVAVSMAPNYGFQSIVVGGIFAQFFSVSLACFCAAFIGECIKTRFWLDLFAGLMFLIFGLYELIGELIMENSNQWAERKI